MKQALIAFILFDLLGTALLAGAAVLYLNTSRFVEAADRSTGTVTDLIRKQSHSGKNRGSSYYPEVSFRTHQGQEVKFVSSVGSNPAAFRRGERVEVLYLPSDPRSARINSFFSLHLGALICGVLGVIFSCVGTAMLIVHLRRRQTIAWLKQFGQRIHAQLTGVEHSSAQRRHSHGRRRPLFHVVAQWQNPSTGQIHLFKSDSLRYDPSSYLQSQIVEVLIDPQNPKRYWMDLPSLPEIAE